MNKNIPLNCAFIKELIIITPPSEIKSLILTCKFTYQLFWEKHVLEKYIQKWKNHCYEIEREHFGRNYLEMEEFNIDNLLQSPKAEEIIKKFTIEQNKIFIDKITEDLQNRYDMIVILRRRIIWKIRDWWEWEHNELLHRSLYLKSYCNCCWNNSNILWDDFQEFADHHIQNHINSINWLDLLWKINDSINRELWGCNTFDPRNIFNVFRNFTYKELYHLYSRIGVTKIIDSLFDYYCKPLKRFVAPYANRNLILLRNMSSETIRRYYFL